MSVGLEPRVFPLVTGRQAAPRRLKAAPACRAAFIRREERCGRFRRGLLMTLPLSWRRCVLGTNHIAAHGVWRLHARRSAPRLNRTGETRWHLCRRAAPAFPLPRNSQQGARP